MISGMKSENTIFVTPKYVGTLYHEPHNCTVVAFPFLVIPAPHGIARIKHEIKRTVMILSFSIRTVLLFLKEKPDIVHIHSPMFVLIALFARIRGKRCYITYHGNEHEYIYNNQMLGWMFNSIFTKTFSLSSSIVQYDTLFPSYANKYIQVDNAVDRAIFFNKGLNRERIILAVGRLEEQKDYPTLLKAFSDIVLEYPDYHLHIAGTGKLDEKLRAIADNLGVTASVRFLGKVHQEELSDLYNKAEIFVLCSLWEGFPKVLLEAIACECKVVATRVDSVPRVLGSGYPFLVNPGDQMDLYLKISSIIADEKDVKSTFKEILSRYRWDQIRSFMENEYNS